MNVIIDKNGNTEIYTIGLEPGELLLESMQQVIDDYMILNGILLTGYGTLDRVNLHYVKDSKFPPTNVYYEVDKPLELTSMAGIIADGIPHIHVTLSSGRDETYGGHLEKNARVLYLAEFSILKLTHSHMYRCIDAKRKIALLSEKK